MRKTLGYHPTLFRSRVMEGGEVSNTG